MNHPDLLATVDVVCFAFIENKLKVALWKRESEPYKNELALPGAIVNGTTEDDNMEDTVNRVLNKRLSIVPSYMEQVFTVGNATRDHRGWSISTVYMAMTTTLIEDNHPNIVFVDYNAIESGTYRLPFDHNELVIKTKERLASKSTYTSLPMMMLRKDFFTINEFSMLYNEIFSEPVKNITLRKRIDFLIENNRVSVNENSYSNGKGRPSKSFSHDGKIHYFDRSIMVNLMN